LLTDRDEISNLFRGPSIDASYQVSVQLAKKFQGRRFLENSVIINRHYDYDIFNQQIKIYHLDIKVIGIKRWHHGMNV
jgi:hypothetical protein